MSEGTLSQEEIDALLQGTTSAPPASPPPQEVGGTQYTQDIRVVLEAIKADQQAAVRTHIGEQFSLRLQNVEFAEILPMQNEVVYIAAGFTESIREPHAYIMSTTAAQAVLSQIMGLDDVEIADAALTALQEAFEQVASATANGLAAKLGHVLLETVETKKISVSEIPVSPGGIIYATYNMLSGEKSLGTLYEVFSAKTGHLLNSGSGSRGAAAGQSGGGMDPLASLGGSATHGAGMSFAAPTQQPSSIRSIQFPQLQESLSDSDRGNLGLLMDVSMEMTVELGRTRRMVRDILSMGEGTIIELDKVAGEPIDILVNKKLIARGEVVIIDENFGVRVTEII